MTLPEADSQLAPLAVHMAAEYPKENGDQTLITHRLSRFHQHQSLGR
jgi:hypothetical protein